MSTPSDANDEKEYTTVSKPKRKHSTEEASTSKRVSSLINPKEPKHFPVFVRDIVSNLPNLTSKFTCIGYFKIDSKHTLTISNKQSIPKLMPTSVNSQEFTNAFEHLQIKLEGEQYEVTNEQRTELSTSKEYTNKVQKNAIFDWFDQSGYFKKVDDKKHKKPNVVCFGRQITNSMLTPWLKHHRWTIYAAKCKDIIFLWQINDGTRQETCYYGLFYEAWKTGKYIIEERDLAPFDVSKLEHQYVVQELTFGEHQLLLVNEVDAQDSEGKLVEIKTYKDSKDKGIPKSKFFTYWGQCYVSGVEKVVVGRRDTNQVLHEEEYTIGDVINKYHSSDSGKCYRFEDRLLTFIKDQFNENNPQLVMEFTYSGNKIEGYNGTTEWIPDNKLQVVCSVVDEVSDDFKKLGRFHKSLIELHNSTE